MKQDTHVHTSHSDGQDDLDSMVAAAIADGLESVAITDHACGWVSDNPTRAVFFPDLASYERHLLEIASAKSRYGSAIRLLSGLEIEVNADGSFRLDPGPEEYEKLHGGDLGVDVIVGSIHSESFEEECIHAGISGAEKRGFLIKNICALIMNRRVQVLAHPIQAFHGHFSNNPTAEEIEQIVGAMRRERLAGHTIYLEINGKRFPHYEQWPVNKYEAGEMSPHDINFYRQYRASGGKFILSSDSHDRLARRTVDFSVLEELGLEEVDIQIL
jgi:histidinol phosphatase-like PHP family hydrolase